MGLFGGGNKRTTTTVQEVNTTQDQRVQVGGSVGSLVSPGATVGGTGAISASPYSTVSQTISNSGASPAQVQTMLDSVFAAGSADRAAIGDLASSLGSGLKDQAAQLAGALEATRAPNQSALTLLIPLGLVALLLWSAS